RASTATRTSDTRPITSPPDPGHRCRDIDPAIDPAIDPGPSLPGRRSRAIGPGPSIPGHARNRLPRWVRADGPTGVLGCLPYAWCPAHDPIVIGDHHDRARRDPTGVWARGRARPLPTTRTPPPGGVGAARGPR